MTCEKCGRTMVEVPTPPEKVLVEGTFHLECPNGDWREYFIK